MKPREGWWSRLKQTADCARWTARHRPRSAAQRGPFDSRGSRSTRGRPRRGPCGDGAGAGGLLEEEQEGWWWERPPTPFRCCFSASAEARWAVDARLAVRQQSCRDSVREGLPVADSYASRTRARNTANQPPAAAASAADWAARCSPTQSAAGTALASPRRCDGCDGGVS